MLVGQDRIRHLMDYRGMGPGLRRTEPRREPAPVTVLDLSPTQAAIYEAGRRQGMHEGWDMARGFLAVDPILLGEGAESESGCDEFENAPPLRAASGAR